MRRVGGGEGERESKREEVVMGRRGGGEEVVTGRRWRGREGREGAGEGRRQ